MADAAVSNTAGGNLIRVRIPASAPSPVAARPPARNTAGGTARATDDLTPWNEAPGPPLRAGASAPGRDCPARPHITRLFSRGVSSPFRGDRQLRLEDGVVARGHDL